MRRNKFRSHKFNVPGVKVHFDNGPSKDKARTKKIILVIVIIVALYFVLADNRGLVHLLQMKAEKHKLTKEIQELAEENQNLKQEINLLKTDPKIIERMAREELGLVKKGEVVYRFINRGDE